VVWNRFQTKELADIHGFPWTRTLVIGAYGYDKWFIRHQEKLTSKKQGFIEEAMKSKPYVLFVGSSTYIASNFEFEIVSQLIQMLHQIGWGLVVRPHPQNPVNWNELKGENYLVHPEVGQTPVGEVKQEDYVSAIVSSSAVVGINTSALLEALIFDKPSFIISNPIFSKGQRETLHFKYLLDSRCFGIADSAETLIAQLSNISSSRTPQELENRELFLTKFLRPKGLDKPVAQIFHELISEKVRNYKNTNSGGQLRSITKKITQCVKKFLIFPVLIIIVLIYLMDNLAKFLRKTFKVVVNIDEKDKLLLYKAMMRRRIVFVSMRIFYKNSRKYVKTRSKSKIHE
jgi:hypothetical protein